MTFRDDAGRRVRIWLPEETPAIPDAEIFMEMLVKRIEGVMREPIEYLREPDVPARPDWRRATRRACGHAGADEARD